MWVLLNRAPTSTNLISTSTQLHLPPPSSFQPPPSSLQHPQQYSNQNIARNWAIFPNLGRKIQICLTENWHTWYTGGADSEFRLIFLKLWPQDQFLGKFRPKKSELPVLHENWHTWYLEDVHSFPDISFLNFLPKVHFWANLDLKIGRHGILRVWILNPRLVFWILKPKSIQQVTIRVVLHSANMSRFTLK